MDDQAEIQRAKLESMAALFEQMEAEAAVMRTEARGGSAQATCLGGRSVRPGRRRPEMTTTILPRAVPGMASLRPVASADDHRRRRDSDALDRRDPWKAQKVVPGGKSFNAVAIAEDESFAIFDVFASGDWDAMDEEPVGRILVPRTAAL